MRRRITANHHLDPTAGPAREPMAPWSRGHRSLRTATGDEGPYSWVKDEDHEQPLEATEVERGLDEGGLRQALAGGRFDRLHAADEEASRIAAADLARRLRGRR